jgi:hypothetical protein
MAGALIEGQVLSCIWGHDASSDWSGVDFASGDGINAFREILRRE